MDEWMIEWMDGWAIGWMDGWLFAPGIHLVKGLALPQQLPWGSSCHVTSLLFLPLNIFLKY